MRKLIALLATLATVFGFATASAIPAQAATKPAILQVSNKTPLPAGGQNIVLLGTNLNVVSSVVVDTTPAQIVSQNATQLVFITPPHLAARVGITLIYPGGKYVYPDSLVYKTGPRRAFVPLPYVPDTLKVGKTFSMQPGSPNWNIVVTSLTPKVCSVTNLIVTGVKKGDCSLQFSITLDSMDPNYLPRNALYDLTVN